MKVPTATLAGSDKTTETASSSPPVPSSCSTANRVVPDEQLIDIALGAATRYASRPRAHVARQKRIFNESLAGAPS
jgi:hypothetical protein